MRALLESQSQELPQQALLVKGRLADTGFTGAAVHCMMPVLKHNKLACCASLACRVRVLAGLEEGLSTMTKGEKAVISCPAEYAKGASLLPDPPGVDRVEFELQLLSLVQVASCRGLTYCCISLTNVTDAFCIRVAHAMASRHRKAGHARTLWC